IVGIGWRNDVLAGADRRQQRFGGMSIGDIAFGAELLEHAERFVEMTLGDRPRAGLSDEAAEREMAERGLVALAEEIEERRALRKVVVRIGGAGAVGAAGMVCAAEPQVFAPRGRRDLRVERVGGGGEPLFSIGEAV